jgi:murein DD-endopeptidase MepM/ murein hydrolase activator NlpD
MSLSPKRAVFVTSSRLAVLAALGAVLSGCSQDFSRMAEGPAYGGNTPNQQAMLGSGGAGGAALQPYPGETTGSIGGVQQAALPPVPGAAQPYPAQPRPAQASYPNQPYPAQQPIYETPRPVAAAPAPAPVQPVAPAAQGWSRANGTWVTLMPGETLDTLSRRYGVPTSAIASANNFADATRVMPGQKVLIPSYSAPSPQAPRTAAAATPPAAGPRLVPGPQPAVKAGAKPPVPVAPVAAIAPAPKAIPAAQIQGGVAIGPHVVKKGETIDGIARSYGTTKTRLMAVNGLKNDVIQPGQKLVLPSGVVLRVAQNDAAATSRPTAPVAPALAPPVVAPAVAKVAPPVAVQAPQVAAIAPAQGAEKSVLIAQEPKAAAEPPRVDKTPAFRWPVRGRVIAGFGSKAGTDRNDGINLAVPEGTSIKSAEDGEVIYSGNELKGYGNLVLVKHADGWVTAYAHASELLVNKGEKVTRGQIIARAGTTGSVQQPQLHFELRKGQKPVDPTQYLTN